MNDWAQPSYQKGGSKIEQKPSEAGAINRADVILTVWKAYN
jgi:hypothetical protein